MTEAPLKPYMWASGYANQILRENVHSSPADIAGTLRIAADTIVAEGWAQYPLKPGLGVEDQSAQRPGISAISAIVEARPWVSIETDPAGAAAAGILRSDALRTLARWVGAPRFEAWLAQPGRTHHDVLAALQDCVAAIESQGDDL